MPGDQCQVEVERRVHQVRGDRHQVTAVIDLCVQPLGVLTGGEQRAGRLARDLGALLAHHRHEARLDVRVFALPVTLDDDPVHLAPKVQAYCYCVFPG